MQNRSFDSPTAVEGNKQPVEFGKITIGMKIRIKQPEGTAYETSADADVGEGGRYFKEQWIDTVVKEKNDDPSNPFIRTERSINFGSYLINDFSPKDMWIGDGILYAE